MAGYIGDAAISYDQVPRKTVGIYPGSITS